MNEVARLLQEVERVGSEAGRGSARVLAGVGQLFVVGATRFDDGQVELFDAVLERLVQSSDERARSALSLQLAPLGQAPRATLRQLAHDEIVVARPILTGSRLIEDQDLISVAIVRGRDHMLAICERDSVSEPVTDVLVARGDTVVHHAIVANPMARFSALTSGTLVGFARADDALLELLGERRDFPEGLASEIVAIGRESARRRLSQTSPESVARSSELEADLIAAVSRLGADGLLTEERLADFARQGRQAELVAAVAYLSGLPIERAQKLCDERDDDLLIVVARARTWSFDTVKVVMTCRPEPADAHALWLAEQSFANLSPSTAGRILHFIRLREGQARSAGDQMRRKVR